MVVAYFFGPPCIRERILHRMALDSRNQFHCTILGSNVRRNSTVIIFFAYSILSCIRQCLKNSIIAAYKSTKPE